MGEITVVNSGEESDFGSSYQEVQNIENLRNWDSTVDIFISLQLHLRNYNF